MHHKFMKFVLYMCVATVRGAGDMTDILFGLILAEKASRRQFSTSMQTAITRVHIVSKKFDEPSTPMQAIESPLPHLTYLYRP